MTKLLCYAKIKEALFRSFVIVKKISEILSYFTLFEKCLWLSSVITVAVCYVFSPNGDAFSLIASLIGVSALIFIAKGNVIGQVMIIIFAILYGIISYSYAYYGEMITYLAMSAPIAAISVITWLRHPYKKGATENEDSRTGGVAVSTLKPKTIVILTLLTIAVTVAFYFILRTLNTENLILSTISVTTSFAAASLGALRSPYYAFWYALNDIVLITMWVLATVADLSYLPMIVCFLVFFINDTYGFISWQRRKKKQGV